MQRPTFLILGTSKAGSTSLYHYLSQHPDVFMSEPKESLFFCMEYERGPDYYWQSYFKAYGGQKEIGDACTKNLYLPFVARRIADTPPGRGCSCCAEIRLSARYRPTGMPSTSVWSH
jgi:hypothetical protein